jgi:hypothetical protein
MSKRKGSTLLTAYREGMEDEAKGVGYTLASVLHYHFIAAQFPPGSEDWRGCIEEAHRAFLRARDNESARRPGRPTGSTADDYALGMMWWCGHHIGILSARELARGAVESGRVPVKGAEETRVDRLARKYQAQLRKPPAVPSREWLEGVRMAMSATKAVED